MFERAVEMSRASALNELVGGEELADCELGYVTSIMLFEAVLEAEDEPLMRKPSAKKDVPADGGVAGLEGEERATVVKRRSTDCSFPCECLVSLTNQNRSDRRRPQPLVHPQKEDGRRTSSAATAAANRPNATETLQHHFNLGLCAQG